MSSSGSVPPVVVDPSSGLCTLSSIGAVPLVAADPRCGLQVLVTIFLDVLSLAGMAFV